MNNYYVCHQGQHIHTIGYLADCQARKNKLPELTVEPVEISTIEDYGQHCFDAGYDRAVQNQYDNTEF